MLYVVATPIGNLGDMTFRAVETLKTVDLILAEDTRKTGTLLKHFEISTKMQAYHDHNEKRVTAGYVEFLQGGKSIALVSDAGTPLMSDPGYRLVAGCREADVPVTSIPGACAAINGLAASGMPVHAFCFKGFTPRKSGGRTKAYTTAFAFDGSTIFYESPHRIGKTLSEIAEQFPTMRLCLAREMTKLHEEFIRGTASDIIAAIANRTLKGEITLIMEGQPDA